MDSSFHVSQSNNSCVERGYFFFFIGEFLAQARTIMTDSLLNSPSGHGKLYQGSRKVMELEMAVHRV